MTAHWGVQDPAAVEGTDEDKRKAFLTAYTELYRRISLFINLPFDTLSKLRSQGKTRRDRASPMTFSHGESLTSD